MKRLVDFIGALILLVVSSPLLMLFALLIKVTSPGEIFFRQERLGKDGRIFKIYKFRTMVQGAQFLGSGMYVEENDTRITPLGKWLRETSLDELPQLINVLKGEMSLVGPRPAPLHHLSKYDDTQRKRLLMKPGLTGWAQIKGRNEILWPERIAYDLWYLEHQSLLLDFYIILKTVALVFSRKGIQGNPQRREKDPFSKGF
ncbi:MAG: sugar transferase [Bacillota bacterium]|jgi:lipopolysaccharide/colanic/teichoic acid biosynthesis glycosyltransferase